MRRILVATDGSIGGDRAIDFAATLARETGGMLTIVNVSNELSREDVQVLAQIESGLIDEMENDILENAKKHVAAQGGDRQCVEEFFLRPVAGTLVIGVGCTTVVDFVQAQVVSSPFEQGELWPAWQRVGQRVGQPREVTIDQLTLQCDCGRRHNDGRVVADRPDNRGNQVRE